MDKMQLLLEAERRGILPADKKPLLDEARRRGLIDASGLPPSKTPEQPEEGPADVVPPEKDVEFKPKKKGAFQAGKEAFKEAVGDRIGLDQGSLDAFRRTFGPSSFLVTPAVDALASISDVLSGAIKGLSFGGGQALANQGVISEGEGKRLARDVSQLVELGGLAASAAPPTAAAVAGVPVASSTAKAVKAADKAGDAAKTVAAAERQGVSLLPADVGGAAVKRATSVTAQTPFGSGGVVKAAERNIQSFDDALQKVADIKGKIPSKAEVGDVVQSGARQFIKRSGEVGEKLYDVAERLADDSSIQPTQTVQVLRSNLQELVQTPRVNKTKINLLNDILADLTDEAGNVRNFDIRTIRDIRTATRDAISEAGLRGTDIDRRLKQAVNAASADIEAQLASTSPRALNAYRRADRFWRARLERIDDSLSKVLGKNGDLSAEQAAQRIMNLAGQRGDAENLGQILKSLPKIERREVVSSIVANLGRKTPESNFSVSTFLTQYRNLSPRAKAALFDADTKNALTDLQRIAEAMTETQRFSNHSNTGSSIWNALTGGAVVSDLAGAGGVATGTIAGGQILSSKLLTSQRFVKWLARAGELENKAARGANVSSQIKNHSRELAVLAASNDNAAADIAAFADALGANSAVAQEQDPNQGNGPQG